jgi:hypothetical protein
MGEQLNVLEQAEGRPGRSPINETWITIVPGERRLVGGDRLCREASIPEPPRHLARDDHGLRIQRSEQLATEQALDR